MAAADPGLMAPSPPGPGQHRFVQRHSPYPSRNHERQPRRKSIPTETTPDAVLNGIITCNQCNAGMALKRDETTGHRYFICSQQAGQSFTGCLTPVLDANQLDKLVVESVMETVMTKKHLSMLLAKTDQLLAMKLEEFQDCPIAQEAQLYSRRDLQAMTTSHSLLVQAAEGPRALRELLRKFIDDIRITPGNAAVHYKIPLPQGGPLAGKYEQDIPLPLVWTFMLAS